MEREPDVGGPTWYAITPVRDCIGSIEDMIESLACQSLPPSKINVIDDGSTDGTGATLDRLARKHPILNIVHKDSKVRDYTRKPGMWNEVLEDGYDYLMFADGDSIFEKDYTEKILTRMDGDPDLVIASGTYNARHVAPEGSGRFIKSSFFSKYYDRFPEIVGYESEMVMRAMMNGYKIELFRDCYYEHVDKLGHSHRFYGWGHQMRALGFYPPFAIARCMVEPLRRNMPVRGALNMLYGYLTFRQDGAFNSLHDAELRRYVYRTQKDIMLRKLRWKNRNSG